MPDVIDAALEQDGNAPADNVPQTNEDLSEAQIGDSVEDDSERDDVYIVKQILNH